MCAAGHLFVFALTEGGGRPLSFVLSALSIMPRLTRSASAGRSGGPRGRGSRSGAADHDGNGTVSRPPTGEGSSASAALQEANLRVAALEAKLAAMRSGSGGADHHDRRRRTPRRRRSPSSSSGSSSSSDEDSSGSMSSASSSSSSSESEPDRRRRKKGKGRRKERKSSPKRSKWKLPSYKKQYGLTKRVRLSIGKALKTKLPASARRYLRKGEKLLKERASCLVVADEYGGDVADRFTSSGSVCVNEEQQTRLELALAAQGKSPAARSVAVVRQPFQAGGGGGGPGVRNASPSSAWTQGDSLRRRFEEEQEGHHCSASAVAGLVTSSGSVRQPQADLTRLVCRPLPGPEEPNKDECAAFLYILRGSEICSAG